MPTYNAVTDLGMDPNGNETVMPALEDAYGDNVTIEFPAGTYLVDRVHQAGGADGFTIRGIEGSRRDVQFLPDGVIGDPFLRWEGGGRHVIENVSFQQTMDTERSLAILIRNPDGSAVRNVEWLGRTPEEGDEGSSDRAPYLFTFDVTAESGVGHVEDLVIGEDAPAEKPPYPRGRPAIRQGPSHEGEAVFTRMRIIDQGSSAFRSTDNPGVCTVLDSFFKDNANANLRFGAGEHPSKVSSADNVHILLTTAQSKPHGAHEVGDAVRVMGHPGQEGAVFRDITVDVQAGAHVSRGAIAAPDWGDHGSAEFINCIVRNDADTPHVNIEPPEEGSFSDTTIYFEDSDFIGSGQGFRLDRPAVFSNCCAADGLDLDGASGLQRGGCRTIPDDPLGDGGGSPPPDGPSASVVAIDSSADARTTYEFTVDGTISESSGIGTGDTITDNGDGTMTASGFVRGGSDAYRVEGSILCISTEGPSVSITRDGSQLDLASFPECPVEPGDGTDPVQASVPKVLVAALAGGVVTAIGRRVSDSGNQ